MYRRKKQILHRNPLDGEVVYFAFKRAALLEEVKKRTAYIGRNRATKDGQSLLQQIALTTDESDIFQSYYLEASAEVYDVLSGLMPEDTTSYKIFPGNPLVKVPLVGNVTPTMVSLTQDQYSVGKVDVKMVVDVNGTDLTDIELMGDATIYYDVKYSVGGNTLYDTKSVLVKDVEVKLDNNAATAEIMFVPDLDGETYEQFNRIEFGEMRAVLNAPIAVNDGDVLEVDGHYYQSNSDGVVATLQDLAKMSELPMDLTDSVMYRIGATAEGNVSADEWEAWDTNAIPAVDICIFGMIVNYVLWHWLMDVGLSDDAMVQKNAYDNGEDKLSSRISKMKGSTTNIVSRTW